MKVLLGIMLALAVPAVASAHHFGGGGPPSWGWPAPAPDIAAGIPAALSVLGAFAVTRFRRKG